MTSPSAAPHIDPFADVEDLMQTITEVRQAYMKDCQRLFRDAAMNVFRAHPVMEKFAWQQFTPYFNDGDVCEFSVHRDIDWGMEINGEHGDELTTWESGVGTVPTPGNEDKYAALQDAAKFLGLFHEDILKDMFGDHARIIVANDGSVTVEHVEHD